MTWMTDMLSFWRKQSAQSVFYLPVSYKLIMVIFSWWKQKEIISNWWGSGHFGTIELNDIAIINCCTLELAGKAFIKTFTKPKDIRVNSNLGPGSEWILGQAGYMCQTSLSDSILFISICLSPVLLLNSPSFHSFPCFWENSNLVMLTCTEKCMHIHESSWIIGKIELSQHWSWQKAIKCSCRVKKINLNWFFFLDYI